MENPQKTPQSFINQAHIERYFLALFDVFDTPEGAMTGFAARGLGEKGTPKEGTFRESLFVVNAGQMGHFSQTWAAHGIGAFIVPAFLKGDADKSPRDVHIHSYTAMLVDIDSGDPTAALRHAEKHIGPPHIIVASGGTTRDGYPKIHAYWLLTEPCNLVVPFAAAREMLARKIGGDPSFGRLPQIIRVPGTVHMKNGSPSPVQILIDQIDTRPRYDAREIMQKIHEMPPIPGLPEAPQATLPSNVIQFTPQSSAIGNAGGVDLVTPVAEGGTDRTRWGEFSKVAGHYIHAARRGEFSLAEAYEALSGWVLSQMLPPWPEARIRSEWEALVRLDIQAKGPIEPPPPAPTPLSSHLSAPVQPAPVLEQPDEDALPEGAVDAEGGLHFEPPRPFVIVAPADTYIQERPAHDLEGSPLLPWAVENWTRPDQIPERRWLVNGLLPAAKPAMLVAEGGAGKTYLALELALNIAIGSPERPRKWLGEPIADYGMAVVITAEDDRDEVAIRLSELDPNGERLHANGRLVVLPLTNLGGAFPLVQTRRVTKGHIVVEEHGASEAWEHLLATLAPFRGRIKLVLIDTFNSTSHGDENSATVTQEYFRQATRVCGELGAALLVTHHFRKAGSGKDKTEIITKKDAANAFRGSEAIKASVRQMITIWEAHDADKRMANLGRTFKEGHCYRAAVTKANNREAFAGMKTLLRNDRGFLVDVTAFDKTDDNSIQDEVEGWIAYGIERLAAAAMPACKTGQAGIFELVKAGYFHPRIKAMTRAELLAKVDDMTRRKILVRVESRGAIPTFDVMDGPWVGHLAATHNFKRQPGSYNPPNYDRLKFNPELKIVEEVLEQNQ